MKFTAVINHIARKAAGVLSALLALVCAVGCNAVFEYKDAPLAVDANLRLIFTVPSQTKADSYSYDDPHNREAMDNVISATDLEIYFFTEDGEYVTSVSGPRNLEVAPYSSGAYDPHYHMYTANMKVDGVVEGVKYRVVVLANKRSTMSNALPFCVAPIGSWQGAAGETDEERLYRSLAMNFATPGAETVADFVKWGWNGNLAGCVPMWGFNTLSLKLATIDAHGYHNPVEPSGQIDMLRSIAKVRIDINPELASKVRITDYHAKSHTGGVRLISAMTGGYMVPAYNKVKGLEETPVILNKDREGGVASGAYTDEWIHTGVNVPAKATEYEFYHASDGSYYIYLPEHRMRQAWMQLEFEWIGPEFAGKPLVKDYKLHFGEYHDSESAVKEEDIDFFPVMRNHYYIYTINNLSVNELKYEVCDWAERSTEIEFN